MLFIFKRILQFLYYLGPLAAWLGLVYASSTHLGTYDASLRLLLQSVHWVEPNWQVPFDVAVYFPINNALRKTAHVVAFGVVTLLTIRALQWGERRLKPSSLIAAVVLGLLFSFSDALIRFVTPNRHVRPEQFLLNALGSALVLVLTLLFFAAKRGEEWLQEGKKAPVTEENS